MTLGTLTPKPQTPEPLNPRTLGTEVRCLAAFIRRAEGRRVNASFFGAPKSPTKVKGSIGVP